MNQKGFSRLLDKKIKAQPHTFIASTRPSFEEETINELKSILRTQASLIKKVDSGTVEFECKMEAMQLAALKSLTINKISLRVANFRAGDLGEFLSKIKKINFELYLPFKATILVDGKFSNCRIEDCNLALNKAKVEIENYLFKKGKEIFEDQFDLLKVPTIEQLLFIRGENNHFTISLLCTPKKFYAHGYRKFILEAPLRETSCQSILRRCKIENLTRLFDVMSGSGTFTVEAIANLLAEQNILFAGQKMQFPFFEFPSFRQKSFNHLLKQKRASAPIFSNKEFYAFDINKKATLCAKNNLEELIVFCENPNFKFEEIPLHLQTQDFFEESFWKQFKFSSSDLIVLNPPYNKRIKAASNLYKKIGLFFDKYFKEANFAILCPALAQVKELGKINWSEKIIFHNGAIRCWLLIYRAGE